MMNPPNVPAPKMPRLVIDSLTQYGTVIFVQSCLQSRRQSPTLYQAAAERQGKLSSGATAENFYKILRELQYSICETLLLRSGFSPDTELSDKEEVGYSLYRAMIESLSYGSHLFVSEGKLKRVQLGQTGELHNIGIQDNRYFEGWRKVA